MGTRVELAPGVAVTVIDGGVLLHVAGLEEPRRAAAARVSVGVARERFAEIAAAFAELAEVPYRIGNYVGPAPWAPSNAIGPDPIDGRDFVALTDTEKE